MTNTENPTVESILSAHGYASIDDAREDNVIRVCHGCQSIMSCTPAEGQTREEQRDILIANFDLDCCPDSDESIL